MEYNMHEEEVMKIVLVIFAQVYLPLLFPLPSQSSECKLTCIVLKAVKTFLLIDLIVYFCDLGEF